MKTGFLYTTTRVAPREGTRPTSPCRPGPLPTGRQALTRRRGLMTFCIDLIRFYSPLWIAAWALVARVGGQTPTELEIQLYPGLTITGTVGAVYSIEYVTDLSQTNA